ncbi:DUF5677 domain-containing protein [Aurantimonas marina]|uniref:DUF5677 domain-containing protein n=1 Tax=Aurantimonas marina TaxID=2780508 RepID=UPI0019D012CB|nr:DUF5677 domain-containing protein [Aurantimonas marina]
MGKSKMKHTPLRDLKRKGKKIESPFNKLRGVTGLSYSSWKDKRLLNCLWLCLIRTKLNQRSFVCLCHQIADRLHRLSVHGKVEVFVTHQRLASLDYDIFRWLMEPLTHVSLKDTLRPLLLVETLPDLEHWRRFLQTDPEEADDFNALGQAVWTCFDHHSQEATDVRWAKVVSFLAADKLRLPSEQSVRRITEYPDFDDQTAARPSIRALEIMFGDRTGSGDPVDGDFDAEPSWVFFLRRTPCILSDRGKLDHDVDTKAVKSAISLYGSISDHYHSCIKTTGIDPRLEASFGLVLFATSLYVEINSSSIHRLSASRIALRTIVECFINLSYLSKEDNETIWLQFRNYGIGKAKLAFLKNVDEDKTPDFIDVEKLEFFANEDYWQEFIDIDLGSWSSKTLRDIAVASSVKDVYDKHYDVLSAFSHGNWLAVRHVVFDTCLNPLHRFHRVPHTPYMDMRSATNDMGGLVNRMVDTLNTLYPGIRARLDRPA